MSSLLDLQIRFDGFNPVVPGDKHRTIQNLINLFKGISSGTQYRVSKPYVQTQSSVIQANGTVTFAAAQAADTFSIGGQALTATQKRASATLTAATAIAGTTAVVNGVTFTGATGAVTPGTAFFSVDTSDTACAASLAAQITAFKDPRLTGIAQAKSAAAVCTVFAVNEGTSGNAITLVGTATVLVASHSTLQNGAAPTNNAFDFAGTDAMTAASALAAVKASTTAAVQQFSASASSAVLTVTSKVGGIAGNGLALVSSNGGRLAVSGSGFLTGGSAGAVNRMDF